jgi:hypothetical protein
MPGDGRNAILAIMARARGSRTLDDGRAVHD